MNNIAASLRKVADDFNDKITKQQNEDRINSLIAAATKAAEEGEYCIDVEYMNMEIRDYLVQVGFTVDENSIRW